MEARPGTPRHRAEAAAVAEMGHPTEPYPSISLWTEEKPQALARCPRGHVYSNWGCQHGSRAQWVSLLRPRVRVWASQPLLQVGPSPGGWVRCPAPWAVFSVVAGGSILSLPSVCGSSKHLHSNPAPWLSGLHAPQPRGRGCRAAGWGCGYRPADALLRGQAHCH